MDESEFILATIKLVVFNQTLIKDDTQWHSEVLLRLTLANSLVNFGVLSIGHCLEELLGSLCFNNSCLDCSSNASTFPSEKH